MLQAVRNRNSILNQPLHFFYWCYLCYMNCSETTYEYLNDTQTCKCNTVNAQFHFCSWGFITIDNHRRNDNKCTFCCTFRVSLNVNLCYHLNNTWFQYKILINLYQIFWKIYKRLFLMGKDFKNITFLLAKVWFKFGFWNFELMWKRSTVQNTEFNISTRFICILHKFSMHHKLYSSHAYPLF